MLPPKGASFVNVLASLTPALALAPKGTVAPNGCMMQASQPHVAVAAVHPDAEKRAPYKRPDHESGEELDPAMRQTAQLAPPIGTMTSAESETSKLASQTRVSLEDLVPQLVKKIAWSGDAQRGTVRMELGAGELAGATLTVSAEAGRVSVHMQTPPGTDIAAWRERLTSRLEGRGLSLESVSVE